MSRLDSCPSVLFYPLLPFFSSLSLRVPFFFSAAACAVCPSLPPLSRRALAWPLVYLLASNTTPHSSQKARCKHSNQILRVLEGELAAAARAVKGAAKACSERLCARFTCTRDARRQTNCVHLFIREVRLPFLWALSASAAPVRPRLLAAAVHAQGRASSEVPEAQTAEHARAWGQEDEHQELNTHAEAQHGDVRTGPAASDAASLLHRVCLPTCAGSDEQRRRHHIRVIQRHRRSSRRSNSRCGHRGRRSDSVRLRAGHHEQRRRDAAVGRSGHATGGKTQALMLSGRATLTTLHISQPKHSTESREGKRVSEAGEKVVRARPLWSARLTAA